MEMKTAGYKKMKWESVEKTMQDKENDKNITLRGMIRRHRGERETSNAFKQRGGVSPDI